MVLNHISAFLQSRFSVESGRMQLNLIAVDSNGTTFKEGNFGVDTIDNKFKALQQTR